MIAWFIGAPRIRRGLVAATLLIVLGVAMVALAIQVRRMWREAQRTDRAYALDTHTVEIPAARSVPAQAAHFIAARGIAPLIVDLHGWSANLGGASGDDGPRLDELAYRHGWNYIRPTLSGANATPAACCSVRVIDAIDLAIGYAKRNARVSSVHVIGGSGGGYTALCGALSGRLQGVADYQAWVPITDLAAWYRQRPGLSYERDIRACTGSIGTLDVAAARRRSPLFMPIPHDRSTIHLFAGVHDGTGGSAPGPVPITHTLRMYNRLVGPAISDATILGLLETRTGPQTEAQLRLQGRNVHLAAHAPRTSLVIFEGGHEILGPAAMRLAQADAARADAARARR